MSYFTRAAVEPPGNQTTIERGEHLTNGLAFPSGSQLDLRFTKFASASNDTVVWCFLYGYVE
jgi:hypothetical protein